MAYPYNLPDLEARFLPSDNWQVSTFYNNDTQHNIHYSSALVDNAIGTIICLPGLSEFGEKYIETARFFNSNGYNLYVIDWAYQGRSTRFKDNPHKRYSDGYEADISDLGKFIDRAHKGDLPLFMLGHSMGGHIGLRYLATQHHKLKAASFSSPMLGIESLRYFPTFLKFLLIPFAQSYIFGGGDWDKSSRKNIKKNIFSNDPIRSQIHYAWSASNVDLQIGNVTFKWVIESLKSITMLRDRSVLKNIETPTLLAIADQENLVDNDAIRYVSQHIQNVQLLNLFDAKHEILMEKEESRDHFLNETLALFRKSS